METLMRLLLQVHYEMDKRLLLRSACLNISGKYHDIEDLLTFLCVPRCHAWCMLSLLVPRRTGYGVWHTGVHGDYLAMMFENQAMLVS